MVRRGWRSAALAAMSLAFAGSAHAAVIHVNVLADDVSSTDGKCSLREAVSAANDNTASGGVSGECPAGDPDNVGTDTITLDGGTYVLTRDTPGSGTEFANVEDTLDIKSSVKIQGPGPAATTIQSQTGVSRVIQVLSAFPNPQPNVTIDGVTISGGRVTPTDSVGGGMFQDVGTLTLTNCAFVDNRGLDGAAGTPGNPNGEDGAGAGALFVTADQLLIDGCRFEDNHAGNGGAGFDDTGAAAGGRGGAGGNGGALWIHGVTTATVKNATFVNNSAGSGGRGGDGGPGGGGGGGAGGAGGSGGAIYGPVNLQGSTITDTTFTGNAAGGGGTGGAASPGGGPNGIGGAGGGGGGVSFVGAMALLRTRFDSNSAGSGGAGGFGSGATAGTAGGSGGIGGAYRGVQGVFSVKDSTISGNSAGDGAMGFGPSGGIGGAGGAGGGFNLTNAQISFDGTTISGNSAGDGARATGTGPGGAGGPGGGIAIGGSHPPVSLLNTTISGNGGGRGGDANSASFPGGDGGRGGGIVLSTSANVTATHVTIAGNSSGQSGANPGTSGGPTAAADNPGGALSTGSGTASLTSSVLAGDGPFACSGSVTANAADTIAFEPVKPSCPGKNVDPLLGPLADNGGLTQTRSLGAGSPALDIAPAATCPATDQRGVARPQGPACDAGAFEREFVAPPPGGGTPGGGTPGGGTPGGGNPGPTPDTTKPVVTLLLLHPHLGKVLKRGYAAVFRSNEKGAVLVEIFVGKKRVARGIKRLTKTGKQTVVAKFTSASRKKYRHTHKLIIVVRVTVTDAAGNKTVKVQRLTLKR